MMNSNAPSARALRTTVGARTPKQVDGWIGAAAIALTRRDLDEIAAAILDSKAGKGPGRSRKSRTLGREVA